MKIKAMTAALSVLVACAAATGCNDDLPGTLLPLPGTGIGDGDGAVGDVDGADDPTNNVGTAPAAGEGSFDPNNTFEHMEDISESGGTDPYLILKQREEEGPPEVRTRLHSCQKLQNRALRNTLTALGVDMNATGNPDPAGELFSNGQDALGAANYVSRTGEALVWTNSGATKMQDIFVMAAPEIIANIGTAEHCQIDGVGVEMFDEENKCNEDAVTCLIGRPATQDHLDICNYIVESASDIERGKAIAVASMLAAAYTCE